MLGQLTKDEKSNEISAIPENFTRLRHIASNMVRAEPTNTSSVAKKKRCLMNPSVIEQVLAAGIPARVEE
ncbi:hypothetical protein BZG77_10265 [Salinivibrio sp. IB643]|nr:hypothetical protein BZG77_10265 [Salinivibrio sp. IB643]